MALVLRQPNRVYPRISKRLPLIDQHPIYALTFNGIDGYVECPVLSLNRLTLACWLKTPSPTTRWMMIMTKGDGTTTSPWEFRFYSNTGKLALFLTADTSYGDRALTDIAIVADQWYHVAATYNGEYVKIYINGVEHGSEAVTGDIYVKNLNTLIAARKPSAPEYFFNGVIALPCIYSRALSPAEIQHNIHNPLNPVKNGLVLFLPMIEGSGISVTDHSGQGNNGTLYGEVSWRELTKHEIPAAAGF